MLQTAASAPPRSFRSPQLVMSEQQELRSFSLLPQLMFLRKLSWRLGDDEDNSLASTAEQCAGGELPTSAAMRPGEELTAGGRERGLPDPLVDWLDSEEMDFLLAPRPLQPPEDENEREEEEVKDGGGGGDEGVLTVNTWRRGGSLWSRC